MKGSQHRQFATYVARTALDRELKRLNADWNPMFDLIAKFILNYDDLASAIGDVVGRLPDSAEERLGSWLGIGHRTYLHSADVYKALEGEKERIRHAPSSDPQSDAIRIAGIEAYQSHIFLDSTTPTVVPEYGWLHELIKKWRSKS